MSERPVSFQSGGLRLSGMMGGATATPRAAVLLHGWSGYRVGPHRLLREMARRLNGAGWATLRFDVRGRGDSEGEAPAVCLDDMIPDTAAAVEFLRRETGAPQVTLIGICSGANVAIGAATRCPEVAELALWSALPFQPEAKAGQRARRSRFYLAQYIRKALQWETWRRLLRGDVNLRAVGRTVAGDKIPQSDGRNLKDSAHNLMAGFGAFRGRALFVTGTMDPEGMAGREVFMPFCAKRGIAARFELIEGATHSYYGAEHRRRVMELTAEWLTGLANTDC